MAACKLGIKRSVEEYIKGKSYLRFNGEDFIEVLTSSGERVNPTNYWGVATSVSSVLNKAINSSLNIGNVFYPRNINNTIGVSIEPTPQQLSLLNAKDEIEIQEAIKDWETKEHQERLIELQQQVEEEKERGGYTEEQKGEFFQKPEITSSTASPKTISIIKDFISRIGVDITPLIKDGRYGDSNGVALIMQKLIQVADGKEAISLPEEAAHFAIEIVKQKNPQLYKKLLNEINSYSLLKEVFSRYSSDENYQTKDGKPDVIKLKEEAIGKILAETIINQAEESVEKPELLAIVETRCFTFFPSI